ncbi:MAG: RNA polymerase sigma factor [Bacteroidales bacterium]|nr:RNA polymerase sigma factor [Bacteroidales bacterium]
MERTGSKLTDRTDVQLVEMALDGSQAAFFTLYARYRVGVCAHIAKIIQDQAELEDICNETFEKAFKQLSTFRTDAKFSTWILTIARNTALDHKDKENTRLKSMETASLAHDDSPAASVPDTSISPEEAIIKSQIHDKFIATVEGLPDIYREIAILCFVENMKYEDISEKTGIPVNTVKTRIRRAKDIITEVMQNEEEE